MMTPIPTKSDVRLNRVTIVGTGLLGGSIGLAMKRAGLAQRIIGAGSRPETLEKALRAGCVDETRSDLLDACKASDLIVLAAPVGKIPDLIRQLAAHVAPGGVVTDVGSTKGTIVAAADATALRDRFVGSHPMAGAETTGPQSARADLFKDRPVILTPSPHTSPEARRLVESFWKAMGMRVFTMDPQEHDCLVAVISHVPHAMAVLLVELARKNGALPVASTGFADTTRLAMGEPELWADIFLDNRRAVGEALVQWSRMCDEFQRVLEGNDRESLLKILREAQADRISWRDRPKGQA